MITYKLKTLFQSIALGLLLAGILSMFGPHGTIATKEKLTLLHQGIIWSPAKSAAFHALILSLSGLVVLFFCNREKKSDRLYSIIVGTTSIILLIYSTFVFFGE
jgi:hypothetical protein